jgi:putative transposase
MARLPRLSLAGHVHHVVQRGHNRQDIVLDEADRERWKAFLADAAVTHGVDVHAWLLLRDHFHLVITPSEPQALGRMMQALGRRHAAEFNRRHGRSGTLWEGRFRSSLVQAGDWVLDCMLYVESHGARHHGSVEQATQGPWSSVSHHLGRWRDPLVVEPPAWWALGNTPFEREAAWRGRLEAMLSPAVVERITQASRRGWPIGDEAFLAHLALLLGRPVVPRPRGRPARRQPELP